MFSYTPCIYKNAQKYQEDDVHTISCIEFLLTNVASI